MGDGDKKENVTRVGGVAPSAPKLPGAPPPRPAPPSGGGPAGESTHVGAAPPSLPKPGAQAPIERKSVSPPAAPSADIADDEGEETVAIGQVSQRSPHSLQRVQPAGHTGVVYLTGDTYLMGRKHGADLPLFSPTASREHARLVRRTDGWYLETLAEKAVIANGSLVRTAVRLEHKMRLQIGG